MMSEEITIYGNLIKRFANNGCLTDQQRTELEAILSVGDIHKNDTFWLILLPMYFLMPRREDEKINTAEMLTATAAIENGNKAFKIDKDELATAIVDRLPDPVAEAKRIAAAISNKMDTDGFERQAADIKRLNKQVNDLSDSVETGFSGLSKISPGGTVDLSVLQTSINQSLQQAVLDSLFNRHLLLMAVAAMLMGVVGIWWGGHTKEQEWQVEKSQLQNQIQLMKSGDGIGRSGSKK
jgi:hypothetical protein